ncbi:MAG TPA: DUF4956 domain-containing protein [Anaerohalosphaeraceae bacterium]|nr:DUF4956 domain-containing protein [Anaerohalosphaeraceae bacterium]
MPTQLNFQAPDTDLLGLCIPIGISLAASVVVYLMYHLFYGSRNIGAGVDRCFILGGPAITALFLGIQSSIPLSLGLLGALSFVRFRTPVKDSAEIGFLLLLIASSIGIATRTYAIVIVLFAAALLALTVQYLVRTRFSLRRFTNLILSLESDAYSRIEDSLNRFMNQQLDNVSVKTVSVMDGRVSLHYQFRKKADFNRTEFVKNLNAIAGSDRVEIFLGGALSA